MKKRNIVLGISGALTLIITSVMNLRLLPAIEAGTKSMRFFDMNSFGYSPEAAKAFISELSPDGLRLALHAQLPLDFVYPVIYTIFFILMINILTKKKSKLALVPALLFASDYTENICSIIMLKSADFTAGLARFASTVTVIKSLLMCAVFTIIAVLLIKNCRQKKIPLKHSFRKTEREIK